jgi:hypothetical protein
MSQHTPDTTAAPSEPELRAFVQERLAAQGFRPSPADVEALVALAPGLLRLIATATRADGRPA